MSNSDFFFGSERRGKCSNKDGTELNFVMTFGCHGKGLDLQVLELLIGSVSEEETQCYLNNVTPHNSPYGGLFHTC